MHITARNTKNLTKAYDKRWILCNLGKQQERPPNRGELGCFQSLTYSRVLYSEKSGCLSKMINKDFF